MIRPRQPRVKDEKHLAFIRRLPCIVTARPGVDAAHIRYGDPARGKRDVGMGEKPDDRWTVPLCREEHVKQHNMKERLYWQSIAIDPLAVAAELFEASGDLEKGERILLALLRRARAW